ncbi:cation diffusion facilitator family transporter [Adlercreutzia aquisgranensis]|uniref:cation diffusion facilitator family transporter n=1 Tax=Adlercreutzia aquisgranensis TaxID=2941323 RepID=UPI00203D66D9|nr:cation diffusion facilitator family transporter [Adlercreutzia aquisgranensis]
MDRERQIVKGSLIGIAGNMVLVAFKLVVGFASHSIAIVLDGVNNATDALSSIVTIVGTKLSLRQPDRKHPFGYGRIEYLTSVVIAVVILVAGLVSLRESVVKIVDPGEPSYSAVTIAVVVVAIIGKIALGICFKRYGERTNSEALIASGIDSNYDAVLSAGTLVVAVVQNVWDVNIDGIVGVVISLVVCKAGVDVLRDALGPIIGLPESSKLVDQIGDFARSFPPVLGVHDVVLDDFGPRETLGLLTVEVPDNLTARQIHGITRAIAEGLKEKFGILAAVAIYAKNTTDAFEPMRALLRKTVAEDPSILSAHGFYVDEQEKRCYFDLVVDFKTDEQAVRNRVVGAMAKAYPGFDFNVQLERDYER